MPSSLPNRTPSQMLLHEFERIDALRENIERVIIGKSGTVKFLVTALLARGHALIEDIPGIGKTSLARALTRSVDCRFKRIQFTLDLLPSDVIGMSILDSERKEFVFKPGPIFAHGLCDDPGIFFITEK